MEIYLVKSVSTTFTRFPQKRLKDSQDNTYYLPCPLDRELLNFTVFSISKNVRAVETTTMYRGKKIKTTTCHPSQQFIDPVWLYTSSLLQAHPYFSSSTPSFICCHSIYGFFTTALLRISYMSELQSNEILFCYCFG